MWQRIEEGVRIQESGEAEGALTKSEVRSQKSEVVFETEIYAPSQKRFAFKGGVLGPIIFGKYSFFVSRTSSKSLTI